MRAKLGAVVIAAAMTAALMGASPATAGPSDLDPSFGSGGLVAFPAGERYDAQGAPLLQSGKILAAGLLRNSSDRVFVDRLTAAGAVDPTFGEAGEVHTNSVAPDRRSATTLQPDGKLVVVAGSNKDGRITLERFTPNGIPDTTFGTSGNGRLSVDLGGTYVKPTAAVATSNSSILVTALSNLGGTTAMTVLRFNALGLDPTFGNRGIARAVFSGKSTGAHDLQVLSNGAVLVAGVLGTAGASGSDVALARFTSSGALDTSFDGDGRASYDTTGTAAPDHANAVISDATGAFAVAGAQGTSGMVARFTSTGARDTAFGTSGVQKLGFVAADLVLDDSARMLTTGRVVTGTTVQTSKWAVARLKRTTGSTLDGAFGTAGTTTLTQCANTSGYGPTGLAVQTDGRLNILGSCGDQGQVTVVRLLGRDTFKPGTATFTVTPARESAGHERVPLANIDPATVLGLVSRYQTVTLGSGPMGSGPMGSGPMGSGPMGSGPMGSGPMGSGPMGSGPMGSGPMGSGPMGSGPMGSGPLADQILLSQLPLLNGQTWEQLLAPYYPDGVPPLQTLTLGDAYRMAPSVVDGLTYGDVDITRTPLRHASLAAIMLTRPLQHLAPPAGGWCAFLSPCPDLTKTTLLELEFAGVNLKPYYEQPLSLLKSKGTDLGTGSQRALLAYLDLRQVAVAQTPLGKVPASELAALLKCNPSCSGTLADQQNADKTGWTTATIGDLVNRLPLPSLPDLSLGQLLAGMVHPAEIPYELADRNVLLRAAELRSGNLQTFSTGFDVDCGQAAGLELVPRLAGDARLVPGSATAAVDGASAAPLPNAKDGKFDLASICAGRNGAQVRAEVTFKVEPGSDLGPSDTSVKVRSALGELPALERDVSIDDSLDPGNSTTDTRSLATDKLVHGWVANSGDVDYYSFPAPAPGTRIAITLSHLPADYDLHVFSPGEDIESSTVRSGPMGSGPMGSGPMGSGPVPDSTGDGLDPLLVEPDTVQDLPMGSGPMGSGPMGSGPMGSGSINRGKADEAVTYLVRQSDAGGTITVRVSGYNGANHQRPYVLRRIDLVPLPAPPCPARTLAAGAPGTWPTAVPNDTETLYLVNRQRLAAANNALEAQDVMDKLRTLAEQTKGVVVPVESAPGAGTGTAYAAWDADPCNEEKANDVVESINAAVDEVRAAGNGLKELRSIVVVGPDAVIPQARLRDDAVLSNEFEYANDARLGANDDAVSGSLRDGFILTDDAYGDFDPTRVMYLPDVALGRLVETAPEISAQVQRYLDNRGVISPTDAAVFGYDLFADGAQEQAKAFNTTADVGNWDAAKALAAINRPTTGFTMVNGHYDHYRGLPSAAFSGTGAPDFLFARDAEPRPDSVLFTMGCHTGLNLSGVTGDALRRGDWPQRMAQARALWTGSTTYSYGDTETVAYTERILGEMAANLAGGKVTVGQALMYAKQRSLATVGVLDKYYTKSSQAATFFGLPMYRLGESGGTGASGMPAPEPGGKGTQTSDQLDFLRADLAFERHDEPRGTFWTTNGEEPLVVQNHPVQPLVSKDVTSPEGRAHGYLIEGLQTEDVTGVDPVIARPSVDLAAHEPEPGARNPFFPARLTSVMPEATASGRRDRLTLTTGQFRGDRQRLFREIRGRVLRSTGDDNTPVAVRRVDGATSGGAFTVRVETEGGGAVAGNILYRTDAQTGQTVTWNRANLAPVGGGVLATGGALPSGTKIAEAIVQVVDDGNNVALSNFKVEGYSFELIQDASAPDPRVTFTPEVPTSGYLRSVPQVSLDPGGHSDATFEYSVDGGPWTPYTGAPFTSPEPAEGHHLIRFRGSDGSQAVRAVAVDRTGPVVVGEAGRAANANNWYDAAVTVTFRCADAVSGVASCPAPRTLSTEGANLSATGSATDRAGNTGTGGLSGIRIDLTNPAITASLSGTRGAGDWYLSALAKFTCTDAMSGIDTCTPDKTMPEGTAVTAEGRAVDRAGRSSTTTAGPVNVDANDPAVAITTADGAVLLPGQKVLGSAGDTAAGSGVTSVVVTYTPTALGVTQTKTATLTCDAQKQCTWAADIPTLGTYRVTAQATEASGRTATSPPKTITISTGS